MTYTRRAVFQVFGLALAASFPAPAQSVISTHSGLVYFFDGAVFLGDQQLQQKFGRFPEIPEGGELRAENGRAEVLLTPGVFLRVAGHSSIRMISNGLSDTKVELLGGSAIVEATDGASTAPVEMIYKAWRVHLPHDGVYRIDSNPAEVSVYKGSAQVSADNATDVTVRDGQMLPLAPVLVAEESRAAASDDFKSWAMSRSQAISSDNATAAAIMDDPDEIDSSTESLTPFGSLGTFSYFPLTGIPGIAVTNPYGLSFWSPFQATFSAIYFPAYNYRYLYGAGWPTSIGHPVRIGYPVSIGHLPGSGHPFGLPVYNSPGYGRIGAGIGRGSSTGVVRSSPMRAPSTAAPASHPHVSAPRGGVHGGHR